MEARSKLGTKGRGGKGKEDKKEDEKEQEGQIFKKNGFRYVVKGRQ